MRAPAATLVLGGFLLLAGLAPSPTPARVVAAPSALPRVTLISDSVAGAISFDLGAEAILGQGVDLFLEPGQGRRLGGTNPPDAIAPPTALQLIGTLGHLLGPTVIMCIGYNDAFGQYAENVEAAFDALRAAGVKRVIWVTLHVSPDHTSYLVMNAAIEALAAQHLEVTVVDWDAYASDHPAWFQEDGTHLTGDGPRAMASLLHATLVQLGIPTQQPPPGSSLKRGS